MSFFSRPLYIDIGKNWKGYGFLYLLFLLALYWIPETMKTQAYIAEIIDANAPHIIEQIPTITITNGTASIKEPVPYTIYGPDKKTPFAVIDTSGKTTSPGSTTTILLTKTALIAKSGFLDAPAETRTFDLSGIDHYVIDKSNIYGWTESFKHWFAFMVFPFALFLSFLFYALQVIFCASVGFYFAKRFEVVLDYKALIRLAAVSFTPAIILQTIHVILDIEFPYKSVISFFLALGYLYYAVGANAEQEPQQADAAAE